MQRRDLITGLAVTAAWPLTAWAQQPDRSRRVGVLMAFRENDSLNQTMADAFTQGLKRLGWVEGRNLQIDRRSAGGEPSLFSTYAAELVGMSPDAILASSAPAAVAMQWQTSTIPIVFVLVPDAVGL